MSLVVLLLIAAANPAPATLDPTAPAVVVGQTDTDGTPGVLATFAVAAPASLVLDQLWDGRAAHRLFAQITRRTVVERPNPNAVVLDYELSTIVGKLNYRQHNTVERTSDGGGVVRWMRLSGDLDAVRGFWRVTAAGPSLCRLEYSSFAATGPRMLYGFIRDQNVSETRDIASRLRAVVATAMAKPATP